MEDVREEQIEALKVLNEYNQKLLNGIHTVLGELRGNRKQDTDEFLDQIIKGINWEIEVLNGTLALLNEKEELLNKMFVNDSIVRFSDIYKERKDYAIADAFESEILPLLEKIDVVSSTYVTEM